MRITTAQLRIYNKPSKSIEGCMQRGALRYHSYSCYRLLSELRNN